MDSKDELSPATIALHWLIAAAILSLIALGIYMVQTESWHLYDLHKSIGLIAFAAIVARVAWRLKNRLPQPVRTPSRFEHLAASAAHWTLLACTVALPLTGMLYSGASGHGFGIFGWRLFPENTQIGKDGDALPFHAGLSDLGQRLHGILGYFLLALIVLHVAAALKHHVIDRDATLTRMLGKRVDAETD